MPSSAEHNERNQFDNTPVDQRRRTAIHQSSEQEPISNKLYREVDLIWSGLRDGVSAGASEACRHPVETVGKFALATAVGFGLTALSRNPGLGAAVARGITTGLSASFLLDLSDPHRLFQIRDTVADTWNSGAHLDDSKRQLASATGRFTFDALPMMCAGALGAEGSLIPTKVHIRAVPIEVGEAGLRLPNGMHISDDGESYSDLTIQHHGCIEFWDFNSPKFKPYREPGEKVAVKFSDGSLLRCKSNAYTRFDQVTGVDETSHRVITYKPRMTMLQEWGGPRSERRFWFGEAKDHQPVDEPEDWSDLHYPGAKISQYGNGETHLHAQNGDLCIDQHGKLLRDIDEDHYDDWIGDDHDILHPPIVGQPKLPPMPRITERGGNHLIKLGNGVRIELDEEGNARVWDSSGRLHTDYR